MGVAMEDAEIDRQQGGDEREKPDPRQKIDEHAECLPCGRVRKEPRPHPEWMSQGLATRAGCS
jgi:hypothetical protein